jgi:hypothetical protein
MGMPAMAPYDGTATMWARDLQDLMAVSNVALIFLNETLTGIFPGPGLHGRGLLEGCRA